MTLLQRFGYYLGGFAIGLVILAFFLKGKKTSFSYGPDARVIKNINSKKIIYSDDFQLYIKENQIDTSTINYILKNGDINFSNSETRKKPCAIYSVEGEFEDNEIVLSVQNCDSIATILNLSTTHD
jgi:hypothetical protein